MEKLMRRLTLSSILMSLLAVTAFAGGPCIPGETSGPPCSQSATAGSTDPGEMNGPPSGAVDLTTIVEAIELALALV